jgi:hypothetical protein
VPFLRFKNVVLTMLKPKEFTDRREMMAAVKEAFRLSKEVIFHGRFTMTADPLVNERERVRMTAHEVWEKSGYRFT